MEEWCLFFTFTGKGRVHHADGAFVAEAGDVVLVVPHTPQDWRTHPGVRSWRTMVIFFKARPHWHEWLRWPAEAPGLLRLRLQKSPLRRTIVQRLLKAHRLASKAHPHREALALNALEEAILYCDGANPAASNRRLDPRLSAILRFIDAHLMSRLTLPTLAREASTSVSNLSLLFRKQVGLAPIQFLERRRMQLAMELLRLSPLPIKEVALRVGIENAFYFSARFRRHVGVSPRQYRKAVLLRAPNSWEKV
jgi:AraC family transcriptional regulator of arabinose operon